MLKLFFWLCGRQAMAVFGLQACLACAGIWLLARAVRILGFAVESIAAVILLGAFPTLIVYQHILLTEVGTFFFFALTVFLLARPGPPSLRGATELALALCLGYYYRSSLVYLAPLTGCIYVISGLKEEWMRPVRNLKNQVFHRSLPQFLIVSLIPFLLAYPWQRNPKVAIANGASVLFFGLVTQGVLPVNDPILGGAGPLYARSLEHAKVNGVFPNTGISDSSQYPVIEALAKYYPVAGSVFLRVVAEHPMIYLRAVGRNLVIFLGLQGFSYDSAFYVNEVLSSHESHIDPGGSWMIPMGKEFNRTSAPSFTSSALLTIVPVYNWLVEFGLFATVAGLFIGMRRLDKSILAFTVPVLAFILLHALVLVSQDRMVVPVQPVLLLNLIMLPTWLGASAWIGRTIAGGQGYFAQAISRVPKTAMILATGAAFVLGLCLFLVLRAGGQKKISPTTANGLAADLNGRIDGVNKGAPAHIDDQANPILLSPGQSVVIEGWLSYKEPTVGFALEEIEGVVNGKALSVQVVDRPDVASFFHNDRMAKAGFRLKVDPDLLAAGLTRVDFVGRTSRGGPLHRFPQSIYLLVK